jgi:hypothetical protein
LQTTGLRKYDLIEAQASGQKFIRHPLPCREPHLVTQTLASPSQSELMPQ